MAVVGDAALTLRVQPQRDPLPNLLTAAGLFWSPDGGPWCGIGKRGTVSLSGQSWRRFVAALRSPSEFS